MANKWYCLACFCYTDITHLARILEYSRENKSWNEWSGERLYLTTRVVWNDDEAIKNHTPIEIPKDHKYLINIILNAHGRSTEEQWTQWTQWTQI